MILMAFRHGLRASELVDLRWNQIDFGRNAALHVRRARAARRQRIRFKATSCGRCASCNASKTRPLPSCSSPSAARRSPGRLCAHDRAPGRSRLENQVEGASPHAASCVRLRAGECRPQYAGAAGVSRAQEYPAHCAIYGVGPYPLQRLLALFAQRRGFFSQVQPKTAPSNSGKVFALKIFDRIIHARYGLSRIAPRSFSDALPII